MKHHALLSKYYAVLLLIVLGFGALAISQVGSNLGAVAEYANLQQTKQELETKQVVLRSQHAKLQALTAVSDLSEAEQTQYHAVTKPLTITQRQRTADSSLTAE